MKQSFTFTIDPEIKEEAQIILESQGRKLSSMIEIYLKKIIQENKEENN